MPDPDSRLLATRQAVQHWLLEHLDATDAPDGLEALNLRVWAEAFLRTTDTDAREAEERLRRQGAEQFVARVKASAGRVVRDYRMDATEAVARAFTVEAQWLEDGRE